MKILHILTSINTGGAEKFCVDICNTQADIPDNQIYLCVLDKIVDQPLIKMVSSDVTVISLNKCSSYSPKIIYRIYQLLSEVEPDIIHLNGREMVYASIPIIIKKIPSIYTVHTMVDRGNKYVNKYFKYLFNHFPSLFSPIAISKSVLDTVKKNYGHQFNKMIYNGSSELTISEEASSVAKFIKSLKKDKDSLVFMSVGRIVPVKNTLLLIKVFNKLLNDGNNVVLCIIGRNTEQEKDYLLQCINENMHTDRIKFLGPKDYVADYLLFADAVCFTSKKEGLGIAILEAFSMGIPVLSTPSGGPSEIIIPGINGYLSKDNTEESFYKILKYFIDKPLKNKSEIIEIYREKYTMKVCAKHYINIYKERILGKKIND